MSMEVNPDDLRTHAGKVGQFSDRLNAQGSKGAGVDLGGETYGIIGQAFSGSVREQIAETSAAMTEIGAGLADFSEGVQLAGDTYQQFEQEVQELMEFFKKEAE